jgi:hypothetical protein
MDGGQWSPASRLSYNLRDTISRCTVQVHHTELLLISENLWIIRLLSFSLLLIWIGSIIRGLIASLVTLQLFRKLEISYFSFGHANFLCSLPVSYRFYHVL